MTSDLTTKEIHVIKRFLLFVLIGFAFGAAAHADTIDLYTTVGFGNLHQYHNVPNSTDAAVDLYLPNQAATGGTGVLLLDGVQYVCPNMPKFPEQNAPTSTTCVDLATGATVYLTVVETWYRKYISQGRLHMYVTRWTLVSGAIER
jgi:hypothetical protein